MLDNLKGNNLIRTLIKIVLHIFWVLPIKNNNILFMSYLGQQYSCSPKYISEYLRHDNSSYNIIWVFKDPKTIREFEKDYEGNYEVIKYGTLKYLKKLLTSKVIIMNTNLVEYLPIRKAQIVVNTLHGGGAYKKYVSDNDNNLRQMIKKQARQHNVFLSSCRKSSDLMIRGTFDYSGKVLEIGLPRNDIFFKDFTEIERKVYKYYKIMEGTKIVLYAPTFRESVNEEVYNIDFKNLKATLEIRFGDNWVVMIRVHHNIKDKFEFNKEENIINVTDYPDMQELLCAADLLITDYSSSIWDFSLMYKPSILFAKDLEHYVKERNFYVPIEEWHFPIVKSNEELIDYIKNFDEDESRKNIEKHLEEFGNFETGRATEIVVNEIKKIIEG